MSIAIAVDGLGKQYDIGSQHNPYGRLTESLWRALRTPFDGIRSATRARGKSIWALRDVSFEVHEGDVVGIIGRNGSGKSTLLKILSRVTAPTTGTAQLYGRVGSLLEVGTGFHPELTGRENVFMSGAVLGMRRAEIIRKFDEIVDFAGVDQFLDTPVKRYSSGMQVRLGFAVAAHLEPEILLIDEVLAVGDAEFQKKCLGKMSDLGRGGRTIVFVSHNMTAMLRLCRSAVLLDRGQVVAVGPTNDVVHAYLESDAGRTSERSWDNLASAPGDDIARLRSIVVAPATGGQGDEIDISAPVDIVIDYWSAAPADHRPLLNVDAFNDDGICIFATSDELSPQRRDLPALPGVIRSKCRIPAHFFAEGRVTLNVAIVTYNPRDGEALRVGHAVEIGAVAFQVVDRTDGQGVRGTFPGEWPGVVRPMFDWVVEWTADR